MEEEELRRAAFGIATCKFSSNFGLNYFVSDFFIYQLSLLLFHKHNFRYKYLLSLLLLFRKHNFNISFDPEKS